jgi:hypothetical protein
VSDLDQQGFNRAPNCPAAAGASLEMDASHVLRDAVSLQRPRAMHPWNANMLGSHPAAWSQVAKLAIFATGWPNSRVSGVSDRRKRKTLISAR